MNLTQSTVTTYRVEEGERYLELSFEGKECVAYDSNLPYSKSWEEWEFYGKAISKIVKKVKSLF
mgnify:CR=1 FL=1